jgi:hypothetical protein
MLATTDIFLFKNFRLDCQAVADPTPRPVYGEDGAAPRRDAIRFNCWPSSTVSMRPSH